MTQTKQEESLYFSPWKIALFTVAVLLLLWLAWTFTYPFYRNWVRVMDAETTIRVERILREGRK